MEHEKIIGQAYHASGFIAPPEGWEWRDFVRLCTVFFLDGEVTKGKENGCSKYRPKGGVSFHPGMVRKREWPR